MSRAEFEALKGSGELTSKGAFLEAKGLGTMAEEGAWARVRHSWRWSKLGSPPDSPYVSTSEISQVASLYAQGSDRVVVRLVLRRSDVLRGLNPHQAEFVARSGAKIVEYAQVAAVELSWGPPSALVGAGLKTGAFGVPAGTLGYWGGTKAGEWIAGDE